MLSDRGDVYVDARLRLGGSELHLELDGQCHPHAPLIGTRGADDVVSSTSSPCASATVTIAEPGATDSIVIPDSPSAIVIAAGVFKAIGEFAVPPKAGREKGEFRGGVVAGAARRHQQRRDDQGAV